MALGSTQPLTEMSARDLPDHANVNKYSETNCVYCVLRCGSNFFPGYAIAHAVSRWLPTAAARVRSRVWSSGICGG
jgi:hypothetical protein